MALYNFTIVFFLRKAVCTDQRAATKDGDGDAEAQGPVSGVPVVQFDEGGSLLPVPSGVKYMLCDYIEDYSMFGQQTALAFLVFVVLRQTMLKMSRKTKKPE